MQSVPVKTPEGVAELASRQRKLGQRHRTVLLLVDGKRTEGHVREMAQQAGAPGSCFDELVDLGLIHVPVEPVLVPQPSNSVPMPLDLLSPADLDSVASSLLPPSLTLQPESTLIDSRLQEPAGREPPGSDLGDLDSLLRDGNDTALEEARALMIRAVRTEAPVAGSLTLLRLRRARTREDLEDLVEEVELRITKPFRGLWASQTMSRVRELLSTQSVS